MFDHEDPKFYAAAHTYPRETVFTALNLVRISGAFAAGWTFGCYAMSVVA